MTNGEVHSETRRVLARAIWRLNALEYVILGVAMALALLAGALVASMVETQTGAYFRVTWVFSSLIFFIVPGAVSLKRERKLRGARDGGAGHGNFTEKSDHG